MFCGGENSVSRSSGVAICDYAVLCNALKGSPRLVPSVPAAARLGSAGEARYRRSGGTTPRRCPSVTVTSRAAAANGCLFKSGVWLRARRPIAALDSRAGPSRAALDGDDPRPWVGACSECRQTPIPSALTVCILYTVDFRVNELHASTSFSGGSYDKQLFNQTSARIFHTIRHLVSVSEGYFTRAVVFSDCLCLVGDHSPLQWSGILLGAKPGFSSPEARDLHDGSYNLCGRLLLES